MEQKKTGNVRRVMKIFLNGNLILETRNPEIVPVNTEKRVVKIEIEMLLPITLRRVLSENIFQENSVDAIINIETIGNIITIKK